jgi:hypothetical protein
VPPYSSTGNPEVRWWIWCNFYNKLLYLNATFIINFYIRMQLWL